MGGVLVTLTTARIRREEMGHILTIFEVENANYKTDRFTFEHGANKLTAIAVASESEVLLATDGFIQEDPSVTRIELCGGISSAFPAQLKHAVPGIKDIPIAGISFGFESLDSVMAYKQDYAAEKKLAQAFIYMISGISVEQIDKQFGQTKTSLVAVPDSQALREVAQKLYQEGVRLIELYGWVSNDEIALLIASTGNGETPVGHVAYPLL